MFDNLTSRVMSATARERRTMAQTLPVEDLHYFVRDRVAFVRAAAARRVNSHMLATMARVETSPSVLEIIADRGCDRHREILASRGL